MALSRPPRLLCMSLGGRPPRATRIRASAKPYLAAHAEPRVSISTVEFPPRVQQRTTLSRAERLDMIGMKARPEMLPPLASFIKFLATNGVVEFGAPLPAGEGGLVVVDRIQQCAFLALYYGHDMGFEFAAFSNGPCSDEMADGIYRLSDEDAGVYGAAAPDMPSRFRAAEFLSLVSGRSAEWMCAAVLFLHANIDYRENLQDIKDMIKERMWRSHDAVDDAFVEVKRRGMFRLDR